MPSHPSSKAPINWPAVLTLLGTPLAAILLIPWYTTQHDFSLGAWISFVCLLAFSSLGITAGYHRLWAHKTYEASTVVRILLMIAGTFAVQNSILYWSSGHRTHHRHVDDLELDPYSAQKGFWYSHIGWMLRDYPSAASNYSNVPDLRNDRLVMWQHQYYLPLTLVVSLAIPAVIGWAIADFWGVMLLGGLLRLIVSHHVTFFINSLCHMFGKRPYTDENTARDNFILAIFTWGEGYHNYHHIFQYDYRNGVKWWQYDPTKWLIWSLSTVGLTRNLRRIPSFNIKRAELAMKFKYAEKNFALFGHDLNQDIAHLQHKISAEYDMFTQTLNDWAKLKERELQAKKASVAEKIHQIDLKLKHEFHQIEQNLIEQSDRVELMLRSLRKQASRV
jgi:stearoyl-CoA desaturase (delta-9 desaturase)